MGSETTLTPRVSTDTGSLQQVGGGGDGVRGDVGEGWYEGETELVQGGRGVAVPAVAEAGVTGEGQLFICTTLYRDERAVI